MKISILWAVALALVAGQGRATVVSISQGLFEQYTVSASDVIGSGFIRFYGPTNDDNGSIFTGWPILGSIDRDGVSQDNYPAYDSIEALGLEGTGVASDIETAPATTTGDSYTLLLGYAINPVCIGDIHSQICGDPGVDIKVTVSTTPPDKAASTPP